MHTLTKHRISMAFVIAALTFVAIAPVHAQTVCTFTRDLKLGDTGEDVRCLQRYLNGTGYTIATSGVGSPGSETNQFKDLTRAAVVRWQQANGISGTGTFGPLSRAKYDALTGGSTESGTIPATPASGTSAAAQARTALLDAIAAYEDADGDNQEEAFALLLDAVSAFLNGNVIVAASLAADAEETAMGESDDDEDADEGGAQDAIDEAESAIDGAQDDIDNSNASGLDIQEAENLLADAEDLFAEAEDAFDDEEWDDTVDLAEDAQDKAEEASDVATEGRDHEDEDEAADLIDEADEAIDEAQDLFAEFDGSSSDEADASELIEDAEDLLADAEDAFDDEDFDEAADLADEALDMAEEAISILD